MLPMETYLALTASESLNVETIKKLQFIHSLIIFS